MTDLEQRKKLLVAECEVYRQLLKLEAFNLRIYSIRAKRNLTSFSAYGPLLLMALPVAGSFFSKRVRFSWRHLLSMLFLGWRTFQRLRPLAKASTTRFTTAPLQSEVAPASSGRS